MRIYLKNIPAKFCRDPIWNDRALFFEDGCSSKKNKKTNDKMSSGIDQFLIWKFAYCK